MLKRLAFAMVSTAMLFTGLGVVTAAPAAADQRPCVSGTEFQDVWHGWPTYTGRPATMGQVNDHFDTRGFILDTWGPSNARDVVRAYPKCPEWGPGYAVVWFDNYSFNWQQRVYAMAPSIKAYNRGDLMYW